MTDQEPDAAGPEDVAEAIKDLVEREIAKLVRNVIRPLEAQVKTLAEQVEDLRKRG